MRSATWTSVSSCPIRLLLADECVDLNASFEQLAETAEILIPYG